ncbi:MAG: oxidoreductase [Methanomicrobiales archaeon]|nr:oxidoreductase [Methanomicrobiales archaeon]NYT21218.1 oxidoreductase [Methanomicrobiales archaeon]
MNSLRTEGCTLTGALSVTMAVTDGITIIHGPDGCVHHTTSLLHALQVDHDRLFSPVILSSSLTESEIIFGGEEALERAIRNAAARNPGLICVLSSCVSAAIGDDVQAVCASSPGPDIVVVPTGGFLGGGFSDGVEQALLALSVLSGEGPCSDGTVTLIGEKNLEYEADAHYRELSRLLSLLGVRIRLRFVRDVPAAALRQLGSGSLNILRDSSLREVGDIFRRRFGTPCITSFPVGFAGTLRFLEQAGEELGIDSRQAVKRERENQERLISHFQDLKGVEVSFQGLNSSALPVAEELVQRFDLRTGNGACRVPVPDPLPVGTAGLSRLLHRWRRICRA